MTVPLVKKSPKTPSLTQRHLTAQAANVEEVAVATEAAIAAEAVVAIAASVATITAAEAVAFVATIAAVTTAAVAVAATQAANVLSVHSKPRANLAATALAAKAQQVVVAIKAAAIGGAEVTKATAAATKTSLL